MSEKENNALSQRPIIYRLALASVLIGIMGLSILIIRSQVYRPWWSEFVARNIVGLSGIVGLILGLVAITKISKRIAIITSLILLCFFTLVLFTFFFHVLFTMNRDWRIFLQRWGFFLSIAFLLSLLILPAACEWKSTSKEKLKGNMLTNLGIVLGALLVVFWWGETCGPVSTALRMACGSNLIRMGKAMRVYANDNQGHYPEPNQWCDLILKHSSLDMKYLYCPGVTFRWRRQIFPLPVPKNERCYYAMNPNCEPNLPSDTVLLFETKGGWNRFSGPELLTLENHDGKGCSVLFNDGHVEFVKKERIADLKWGVEK